MILGFGIPGNTQLAQEVTFSAHAELVAESQVDPLHGEQMTIKTVVSNRNAIFFRVGKILFLGFGLHRNTQLAQEVSFNVHAELVAKSQGNPYMGNRLE